MRDEILRLNSVNKSFGGVRALNEISLGISRGTITLVIGPNGSGKTTLINVISGVYKPDSGQIFFDGHDITGLPPHKVARLGLARTFQIPQPFLKLSVLENLLVVDGSNPGESFLKAPLRRFWARHEEELVEKAFRILRKLRLEGVWDREAYSLSGGQMKLLEVGRTLMSGARLILMDEPAGGVNPTLAHEVFSHLVSLKSELGITFLIIEHRLDIAIKYVDHCYAMFNGSVIASGRAESVLADMRVIESYLGG